MHPKNATNTAHQVYRLRSSTGIFVNDTVGLGARGTQAKFNPYGRRLDPNLNGARIASLHLALSTTAYLEESRSYTSSLPLTLNN